MHIKGDGEAHDCAYKTVSRLTQTTDPEGYVKSFTYDSRDNIGTVTDGRGGLTTFAYDPLDRLEAGRVVSTDEKLATNRCRLLFCPSAL